MASAVSAVRRPTASGVTRTTLTLVDGSRPTPPNGSYPGAPNRTLETVVSYPAHGRGPKSPLPLVVFATGFGGTATNYAPLYDHWVKAGYVVAAPTFPLSGENSPGGMTATDLKNQPGDVRFVTGEILRLNGTRSAKFRGLIDPTRVALAGKSLGALTVFDAGYKPTERVPNIKAVIAMTGIASGADELETIGTPLLLEHGDADTTVPISGSRDAYARAKAPKFFVTLFGQTHGSAFGGGTKPAERVVEATTTDFLDRYLKGQAAGITRLQRDGDVPGVASLQATP
jgi:dienelactone hydrolase